MRTMLEVCANNAVLATGLAMLAVCLGRLHQRPAFRHMLWLSVLLKLIAPPLVLIPLTWLTPPNRVFVPSVQEPDLPAAKPNASEWFLRPRDQPDASPFAFSSAVAASVDWAGVLQIAWWAGAAAWFALASIQVYRSLRLCRCAYRAPVRVQHQARVLAGSLGLRQVPEIWVVPAAVSPMLWWLGGFPRILIPTLLLQSLGEEQRATLLVHELAHLRRRDHWTRLLEVLVTGLYWWHPIVWWARREIRRAEEECCDAWVLRALPRAGYAYATTLLHTLDFLADARPPLPLGASGIGYVSHLRRRLTMIMSEKPLPELSGPGRWGLLAVALVLMLSFESQADPQAGPKKGPEGPTQADVGQGLQTVQGTVQGFTTGPKGDVHGFVLNNGTEVHFPPHLEKQVTAVVKKGDRVQVSGHLHTGPRGDRHFEADLLTNLNSQAQVKIEHPPPPQPKTVEGVVQKFTAGPKGDVHGFLLKDGTEIRFPPHMEKRVTAIVAKNDRVRVSGRPHTGPSGDTHLEAESITNVGNQASVKIDHPRPPQPKTMQGIVQQFTAGPKGDVHGFILSDGTDVHFPPHMEKAVTAAIAKGDRVQVSGRLHTGPKGDTHLDAESIRDLANQTTVKIEPPPPPQPKAVEGVVQRFTSGPKGDVHGFVLSDGTDVHFPPHLAKRVTGAVAKGDRVRVSGGLHTGPKGDTHLVAESITNLGNQRTVNIAHGPPPPKDKD